LHLYGRTVELMAVTPWDVPPSPQVLWFKFGGDKVFLVLEELLNAMDILGLPVNQVRMYTVQVGGCFCHVCFCHI
jgi:hypothetical protein